MMQCPMLTRYWKKKTADGVNRNKRNARVEETHQRVYLVLTHCTTIAQNSLASKLNGLVIPIVDAKSPWTENSYQDQYSQAKKGQARVSRLSSQRQEDD